MYKRSQNEIIHVQYITHHVAMPLYEITRQTPYCHQNYETVFSYLTFWSRCISHSTQWPQMISWVLKKSHCPTHFYIRKQDLTLQQYTVRTTVLCQWRNNGKIQSGWRMAYNLLFWSHVSVLYQKEHLTGLCVLGILRCRIVSYRGNNANRDGRTKLQSYKETNSLITT